MSNNDGCESVETVVLFVDELEANRRRRDDWTHAGFQPLSNEKSDGDRNYLLLVHAQDVVAYLQDVNESNLTQIDDFYRSTFGPQAAILYFSGSGDASRVFDVAGIDVEPNSYVHCYVGSGFDGKEAAFADRVKQVAQLWTDPTSAPQWERLYTSWLADACDFASALCLLGNDGGKTRVFLDRLDPNSHPFGEERMREARQELFGDALALAETCSSKLAQVEMPNVEEVSRACRAFLAGCAANEAQL